jgi:uncharacterized integral membrane protein (TIGR00697 family)
MKVDVKKMYVFAILSSLYCTFTVIQNLFEMKTLGTANFAVGGGGVMLSWATFMLMDISTELLGKKDTMRIYTFAGLVNLLIVVLAQILIALPGTYPEQNAAFAQIFSNGVRTAFASFTAFWVGNFVNMQIMLIMKKADTKGSKFMLFLRAVLSTVFGQFVDNAMFATLAFAPIGLSLFEMTWKDIFTSSVMGVINETVIETIWMPLITLPVISKLRNIVCE